MFSLTNGNSRNVQYLHLGLPGGWSLDVFTILILDFRCFKGSVNPELQSSKNTESITKKQCAEIGQNKNCKGEKGDCFYVTDHNCPREGKKINRKSLMFVTRGPASLAWVI